MSLLKTAEGELLLNDIPVIEALADIEITNRFIKLAQTLKKIAPKSNDFTYFTAIFMHASEASLIDLKTGEPKKDKGGKAITGGFDDKWKWSCSDPGIGPYFNQNYDSFPEAELKLAYKKWISKPLCVNHLSNDVEGIRGLILDTHYDEKFKRVVGLCAVDSKTYPDLAHKIKSGYASSVSMGTVVAKAVCAQCGNEAITEKDYCDCMRNKKGEINIGLSPIELSLVVSPADPSAKILKIIASMNNYTDQRNTLLESKDVIETQKLAKLDSSIKTIENQLNRLFSECSDSSCQFVRDDNGHIKLIKSAQAQYTWKDFFDAARDIDGASDYDKRDLFDSLNHMRQVLQLEDLRSNPELLMELADVMGSKNKYLHEAILQPVLDNLKAIEDKPNPQPMQENQFTTPDGPDKDLGLDSGSEVTLPQDEQQTGGRMGKVVNPSEQDVKPNKGGDMGPELGTASDRFQFGNMASMNDIMLMAKGGKTKTADIDENLNLLLKQTQEIETEMNKMKEILNTNNTNTVAPNDKVATAEDLKMNEARLKIRAAQRKALLEKEASKTGESTEQNVKLANMTCLKCNKVVADEAAAKHHTESEHRGEEGSLEFKKAYWLGTEEPKPGQVQYKPENGGEPKIRMNDKQMHQDKSMGGADKSFPGDEAEKKKLLRAELEDRALKRRAYWLGTEEPTPGKPQYKADPLNLKARNDLDKQMHQDKSMGGADGSFPGDEAEKKKLLRAELVPGILRTKFSKVRNADGSYNKQASYFQVFAGENKILEATAEEIYGDELEKAVDGANGKTGWELLSTPEYGKEVMAAIRSDGFDKVAYLLKGAQAMPEMPPAMDATPVGAAGEAPKASEETQKMPMDANNLMSMVGTMEDTLGKMKTEITGEDAGDVKDMSVETKDDAAAAQAAGEDLTASIKDLGREVCAELDRSADEIALLASYFEKSATLSNSKRQELNKLAEEAVADGQALLEEAETILAVAGKVPAGLKAFQEKQKSKKKDDDDKDDKKEDKKEKDEKGKKEDKKDDKKSKDKKDDKKKDKKKSKKAELAEALLKLAGELETEEAGDSELTATAEDGSIYDELDKEMEDLGLLPKEDDAEDKEMCGMCGMAKDKEHMCTASAKDELIREALASRRAKREALLKSAEEKKYDVCQDSHGLVGEAHKGSEANPATHLDVKPAGDGAVVEGLDKVHDAMMDAAQAAPTGKQGMSQVEVKEAEIKEILEAGVITKKVEDDKAKFRVKLRRAYDLGLQMQERGMISRTKEALDNQVDEVMKFDDQAFESFKRVVANTNAVVKVASANVPQVGVREDNSQPGDNSADSVSLVDKLKNMW